MFKSSLLAGIIAWCFTATTCSGVHKKAFQIVPNDVNIYFDTPKRFQRYCAPPSHSDFVVVWWKNNKRLVDNIKSNVRITVKKDEKTINSLGLTKGSKVSVLELDPVSFDDRGKYSCSITNNSDHFTASFNVKVTDECHGNSFKCPEDKICILKYSLCDGVGRCKKNLDESTQAGCALPLAPEKVEVLSHGSTEITIKWDAVEKATTYEIELIYPNKRRKKYLKSTGTIASIKNLTPGTTYRFRLRTKSLTGYSNFTKFFEIKTIGSEYPAAPVIFKNNIITTTSDISLSWDPVPESNTYEIVIRYPDGSKASVYRNKKVRTIRFKDLQDDTTYTIKVRARSIAGFGRFSKVTVKTLKIHPPGPPINIFHFNRKKSMGITIVWESPNDLGNSFMADISYLIEYCEYKPYQGTLTVLKNVTEPVLGQNKPSLEKTEKVNTSEDKSDGKVSKWKQVQREDGVKNTKQDGYQTKTVLKKVNITVTKYKRENCKTELIRKTSVTYTKLKPSFYWYKVTTLGAKGVIGNSTSGNFTIKMYTTTTPVMTKTSTSEVSEEFSGIIIFAIVTASLCVILIVAFLLAWACKWKVFMDAVAEYRVGVHDAKHLNISGANNVNHHANHNNIQQNHNPQQSRHTDAYTQLQS